MLNGLEVQNSIVFDFPKEDYEQFTAVQEIGGYNVEIIHVKTTGGLAGIIVRQKAVGLSEEQLRERLNYLQLIETNQINGLSDLAIKINDTFYFFNTDNLQYPKRLEGGLIVSYKNGQLIIKRADIAA